LDIDEDVWVRTSITKDANMMGPIFQLRSNYLPSGKVINLVFEILPFASLLLNALLDTSPAHRGRSIPSLYIQTR